MSNLETCLGELSNLVHVKNYLHEINAKNPLSDQIYLLSEDMFHAIFNNGLIVDVGFYPWSKNGKLKMLVIQNEQWNTPLIQFESVYLDELINKLIQTLCCVDRWQNGNEQHIGIKNPKNLPIIRNRPHGSGE